MWSQSVHWNLSLAILSRSFTYSSFASWLSHSLVHTWYPLGCFPGLPSSGPLSLYSPPSSGSGVPAAVSGMWLDWAGAVAALQSALTEPGMDWSPDLIHPARMHVRMHAGKHASWFLVYYFHDFWDLPLGWVRVTGGGTAAASLG